MPVLTTVRQSPAYLYVKTYCLCAIITLFQAAPLSSQLLKSSELASKRTEFLPRVLLAVPVQIPWHKKMKNTSVISNSPVKQSGTATILKRWLQRAVDLTQIKNQLRHDDQDLRTYPELKRDAAVRSSSSLHHEELRFIELRKVKISSKGVNSLHAFLGLPKDEQVDAKDVPLIALGSSGGGYRAMYGFAAFMSASKKLGLWDCITWTAGVSGSCWTLAAYYTIANHNVSSLIRHYLSVAEELAHPMSLHAFDTVVRSSRGVYFLLGPLIRKVRSGIIGLGIMHLYGTLTTTYQLLSREPTARLSRATFQFSKVWSRSGIDRGLEPMPILTAVRRAPKDSSGITPLEIGSPDVNRYIPTWSWGRSFVSRNSVGRPPEQSLALLLGQCTSAPAGPLTGYISALLASIPKGTIMSRLLLLLNDFVRMKNWERLWGNPIRAGHDPNPFYGHNNLPKLQERSIVSTEVSTSYPESSNSTPIRVPVSSGNSSERGHLRMEFTDKFMSLEKKFPSNCGSSKSSTGKSTLERNDKLSLSLAAKPTSRSKWEHEGRIRLMDTGMSNNLPSHVLARPERGADIIMAFDASSDVQKGSAIQRIQNFAEDCHLVLDDVTTMFDAAQPRFSESADGTRSDGMEVAAKFLHKYARVFLGKRRNGEEMYFIYCPLLPNGKNPDFDPSTASFSNSYNLVWTPEQIQTLFSTYETNLSHYAIETIRQVIRKVYTTKKKRRLASMIPNTGSYL
ncbi:FabD/lysophospholipase-like protein [Mollisia scopiformis]|uniref:Lysophospholipase n=1 Tax=Mollisia scopiformis TaxID=149040 RepID=A0A194X7I6_MOLSC|nr:FabD/lysophospholipase-like protein [Mollisia scopiformis]KUJ16064.1 FabD/lysophospholipase-like protein [Mollisia scopiformis]